MNSFDLHAFVFTEIIMNIEQGFEMCSLSLFFFFFFFARVQEPQDGSEADQHRQQQTTTSNQLQVPSTSYNLPSPSLAGGTVSMYPPQTPLASMNPNPLTPMTPAMNPATPASNEFSGIIPQLQ